MPQLIAAIRWVANPIFILWFNDNTRKPVSFDLWLVTIDHRCRKRGGEALKTPVKYVSRWKYSSVPLVQGRTPLICSLCKKISKFCRSFPYNLPTMMHRIGPKHPPIFKNFPHPPPLRSVLLDPYPWKRSQTTFSPQSRTASYEYVQLMLSTYRSWSLYGQAVKKAF